MPDRLEGHAKPLPLPIIQVGVQPGQGKLTREGDEIPVPDGGMDFDLADHGLDGCV